MAELVAGFNFDAMIQPAGTGDQVGSFIKFFHRFDHKALQSEHGQDTEHQQSRTKCQYNRSDSGHDLTVDFMDRNDHGEFPVQHWGCIMNKVFFLRMAGECRMAPVGLENSLKIVAVEIANVSEKCFFVTAGKHGTVAIQQHHVPVVADFDIFYVGSQIGQGDINAYHAIDLILLIEQSRHSADIDIRGGDRAIGVGDHHFSRVFFAQHIPGSESRIVFRRAASFMGSHKTAVFTSHVNGIHIFVSYAVIVEEVNNFLFHFSNIVLESRRVGGREIGKIFVISRSYPVGRHDAQQIPFNALDDT